MQQGQVIKGKCDTYTVIKPIGEGGFGLTYRVLRQSSQEKVVLKLLKMERALDWKSVELFEREAKVLQALSHSNIPQYIDSFPLGDDPSIPSGFALIQSFVEGPTLREVMRNGERLTPEEMFRWFWQMLEVCRYLHSQNPPVIHRDINPKNIILAPHGEAVLIDFGTVQARVTSEFSMSSTSAGTFGYAPHEQFIGRATPSSDLYGLAMTFLAVSTGREPEQLPFLENRVDIRKSLGAQVDARLVVVLEQMTAPITSDRLGSAKEVMERLFPLHRSYEKNDKTIVQPVTPFAEGGLPCPFCQAQVTLDDLFCSQCGNTLQSASGTPADIVPPTPVVLPDPSNKEGAEDKIAWALASKERLEKILPEPVWSVPPGIPLHELEHVVIDDAGTYAVLICYEACFLLTLHTMKIQTLFVDSRSSRIASFSPDGQKLVILDSYQHLYLIDLHPEKPPELRAVAVPKGVDTDSHMAVSPDHQLVAISTLGKTTPVLLLDWKSGTVVDRLEHERPEEDWSEDPPKLFFSPDGSSILCLGEETNWIFQTEGEENISSRFLAFSPDGKSLASLAEDDTIKIGSLRSLAPFSWKKEFSLKLSDSLTPRWFRFSPDSRRLVASFYENENTRLCVIDVASGKLMAQIDEPLAPGQAMASVEHAGFAADGRLLVFGNSLLTRCSKDTSEALLFFSDETNPLYLGLVRCVKRDNQNQGGNLFIKGKQVDAAQFGVEISDKTKGDKVAKALSLFAAPPGESNLPLPFGQTSSGFFSRLDAAKPLGSSGWITPFEQPDLVQYVLLSGEESAKLSVPLDQLRLKDFNARQEFWQTCFLEGQLVGRGRELLSASAGLTHLLPYIVMGVQRKEPQRFGKKKNKKGKRSLSTGQLLKECATLTSRTEAEREVLFENMIREINEQQEKEVLERARKKEEKQRKKQEKEAAQARKEQARKEEEQKQAKQKQRKKEKEESRRKERELDAQIMGLQNFGLRYEEAPFLLLFPIFAVAWSDQKLQKEELSLIVEEVKKSTLLSFDENHDAVKQWMAPPVSQEKLLEQLMSALIAIQQLEARNIIKKAQKQEMFRLCQKVASASGGFWGLAKVSGVEQVFLSQIEAILEINE